MTPLAHRPYHAFLSYDHDDKDYALAVHRWLTADAGFNVWLDVNNLQSGTPVLSELAEQMALCQNWLVLTSRNALGSQFVAMERNYALNYSVKCPGFKIINVRIDDCDVERAWPVMGTLNWIDAFGGNLSEAAARDLIDRLDGRTWSGRQEGLRDVYLSRGWRPADQPFADAMCQNLCLRTFRLRMVGDSVDQGTFSADRVRDIIAGCSGHVAILPARKSGESPTEADYKYFLRELTLSHELGVPQLLIAESATALPPSLDQAAARTDLPNSALDGQTWEVEVPEFFEQFLEDLTAPKDAKHFFFAAEFRDNIDRVAKARSFIEAVSGVYCAIGKDFEGQGLRERISASISTASLFIANLASMDPATPNDMHVNLNTCVEAGIAFGASASRIAAGKPPLPIFLLAYAPAGEVGRTERLPFLFRDSQITWYASDAEMLAHCRRLLQPYRRRILNFELTKTG
jgi:hypothetical protein